MTKRRRWCARGSPAPAWLDVQPDHAAGASDDRTVPTLDRGERAVIALPRAVSADLVLMDDRDGVTVARQQGLAATGTLGVLDLGGRGRPSRALKLRDKCCRHSHTHDPDRDDLL